MTWFRAFVVLLLVVIFGGVFGYKAIGNYFMGQYFADFQPPPVSVSVAAAQTRDLQPRLTVVGTLEAVNGVHVASEIAGIVATIDFTSGQEVSKGERLIQLDTTVDRAELQGLEAELELARANQRREADLVERELASQAAFDVAQAEFRSARAAVAAQEARIAKKAIRAPFTGRVGIRLIDLGQYLAPGTSIVSLQALDPILVDFTLPEQELPRISEGQSLELRVDAYPGEVFQGEVRAIDAEVDARTRNILVQGSLNNADGRLRPGMYAVVDVLVGVRRSVVSVPESALTYAPYGDSVFVVERPEGADDGDSPPTVERRFVKVGQSIGTFVAITEGLEPGDEVVTAGQLKLRNGSAIAINNSVDPTAIRAKSP